MDCYEKFKWKMQFNGNSIRNEKIINSKDINITTLKLSTLSSSLSNLKQKAEYILDLYSNKFKKKK